MGDSKHQECLKLQTNLLSRQKMLKNLENKIYFMKISFIFREQFILEAMFVLTQIHSWQ
jgi:hypothetical protein